MRDQVLPLIEDEVRELVRSRGVDPVQDGWTSVGELVDEVVDSYERRTEATNLPRIPTAAHCVKRFSIGSSDMARFSRCWTTPT